MTRYRKAGPKVSIMMGLEPIAFGEQHVLKLPKTNALPLGHTTRSNGLL